MNRKKKILFALISVLICFALTAAYFIFFVYSDDKEAPVITMDSTGIKVSVTASAEKLMQGVTANDNVDGDVSDTLLVEGISNLKSDNTATITYLAYDKAGNVGKASRTIEFTDYKSPVFGQTKGLVFSSGTSPDVISFMTAEDKIDGDISRRIKGTIVSDTTSLSNHGVHEIEFRVTNSLGDTQYITLPVEVYDAKDYNAQLELTDYLVYIDKGEEFIPEKYLSAVVAGNSEYPVDGSGETPIQLYINRYVSPVVNPAATIVNAEIDNPVDNTKAGVYSVFYKVDYDGRYTACTRLNVVVED